MSADKGGATVIMDKVDYVNKANQIFEDREAYAPLAADPTKKQAATIKKKVNELARLKLISPDDSRSMTLNDPRIARSYGLQKVHKTDAPLRIIVPLIGSPTYNLAKWLYKHLKHLANGSQYSIKNSQAFLQKIQGLEVSPDDCIISFDVVALFSSIPHDLAIDSVARCLEQSPIGIPTEHVLDMLKLCLKNYCQFDGKYYQQVKGTPMGSPISGLLAELVLQRLEQDVVQTFKPKMWLRYVDDTFVIIKTREVERLHQGLNSVFSAIQFTREEATGDTLPFLDGISEALSRQLKRFGISIAHKPASSLRETLCRVKDPVPKEQLTNVIYRIPCANCPCDYIGHTGRCLGTRINEHKLALRRRDPLSLVFAHAIEHDHRFNWDGTEVIAKANTRQAREFLEAWHSGTTSINRHVDLDAHYEGLRTRSLSSSHTSTFANPHSAT
ncbi:hypothetical protein SprV_0100495500 [Sparganum proliferum]